MIKGVTIEDIEKAAQEIEDMANHPSMKRDITGKSMCIILDSLNGLEEKVKEQESQHTN